MVAFPITVLGEIYTSIYYGSQRERNTARLNSFLASGRVEILHIDEEAARLFGEISAQLQRAGTPIQQNDIWIAALCKQHGFALATADQGFSHVVGLEVARF